MRFANVGLQRVEASPGLVGVCPACSTTTIAKCGNVRIWHWAHKAMHVCDQWKEPETAWHRAWKCEFPDSWQEVISTCADGSKHRADVQTPLGATIEFQHSPISPEERRSREDHYGNLIWVVDGSRLARYSKNFFHVYHRAREVPEGHITFMVAPPSNSFPGEWCDTPVPLVIDFGESDLMCLWPRTTHGKRFHFRLTRRKFIDVLSRNSCLADDELIHWRVKYYMEKIKFPERTIPVSVFT